MATSLIKRLYIDEGATTLGLEISVPANGARTLAIASREDGAVTVHARVSGDTLALASQVPVADLPATGDVAGSMGDAGAEGADGAAIYAVISLGSPSESEIQAELEARAGGTGPGELPSGTILRVTSGGRTTRDGGALLWSTMPPDTVMGRCVDSSTLSKIRVIFSRSSTGLPAGTATEVLCSRGTTSQVVEPDWTLPGGAGTYAVGILKPNVLQGLSGDVDLEWTRLGNDYDDTAPVTSYNPGGSGVTIEYDAISRESTADWDSGEITVTEPV